MRLLSTLTLLLLLGMTGAACAQGGPTEGVTEMLKGPWKPKPAADCGLRPNDWCPAPPGDPCGAHLNEKSCRADPKCKGMPYRGESVERCKEDLEGFWTNCTSVGFISRYIWEC